MKLVPDVDLSTGVTGWGGWRGGGRRGEVSCFLCRLGADTLKVPDLRLWGVGGPGTHPLFPPPSWHISSPFLWTPPELLHSEFSVSPVFCMTITLSSPCPRTKLLQSGVMSLNDLLQILELLVLRHFFTFP